MDNSSPAQGTAGAPPEKRPDSGAGKAPGSPRALPFSGVGGRFLILAGLPVAVPVVLFGVGWLDTQLAGLLTGIFLMTVCALVALWAALDTALSRWTLLGALLVTAGSLACAIVPLHKRLYPGTPDASAVLATGVGVRSLGKLAAGRYELMIEADVRTLEEVDAKAEYALRLFRPQTPGAEEITGAFQSRHGERKVGRSSVPTVKAPPRWERHPLRLESGTYSIRLVRKHRYLGKELSVRLFRERPLWPFIAIGVVLLLAGALVAGRLGSRLARTYLVGGTATIVYTGLIGTYWTWRGDGVYPLVAAAFVSLIAGWLTAKILNAIGNRLPWALAAP